VTRIYVPLGEIYPRDDSLRLDSKISRGFDRGHEFAALILVARAGVFLRGAGALARADLSGRGRLIIRVDVGEGPSGSLRTGARDT
jgi:hypothetical protein